MNQPPPGYHHPVPPRPPLNPTDERTWAILLHLSPLIGFGLWAPLVVWLVFRGRGPFLEHHALQALNFHITIVIAAAVTAVVGILTFGIGLVLVLVVMVWQLIFGIVAAVAAHRWEWYRYPATLQLVR